MSRVNVAAGFGEWPRSPTVSTKLLESAYSFAQRLQLSLEGLGGVSNLFLLTGVGAGIVVSCLTGVIIDRSLGLASNERIRQTTSGFAGITALPVHPK